jgi:signal transduction histidine kinase
MKQDFVSNVTHELKTPLTSIRMYAETLSLGRARNEEKRKEYLEHIIRESERLQRLIDDILDFAWIGEGKKPYVLAEGDVTEAALEAIELFRHSAKVRGFELYLDLPALGQLPPVDLDKDALVRSVLNLLSNSVKYSPDSHYVSVSVKREGDMIAVAVSDKGIGIAPEDLERIFDRFYRVGDHLTRAIPGAGLGLSLVDEIVRAHGGQIRVESEKGKGSKFTILLPIVQDYRNVPWPPAPSAEESAPPEDERQDTSAQATPMSGEGGSA